MAVDRRAHWDATYAHGEQSRSWFQETAGPSLRALGDARLAPADPVIDIGGGASRLVDGLLERGFTDVTVLDVSPTGLQIARDRLGEKAARVTWLVEDLLTWRPTRPYAAWHDRAVLHFLVDPDSQQAYAAALQEATRPGSVAVLATFGPEGPTQCSGLPVARHDAGSLSRLVGPDWALERGSDQVHRTPSGGAQAFTWAVLRRHR